MKILKSVPVEIETSGADDHQCSVHCQFCDGEVDLRSGLWGAWCDSLGW